MKSFKREYFFPAVSLILIFIFAFSIVPLKLPAKSSEYSTAADSIDFDETTPVYQDFYNTTTYFAYDLIKIDGTDTHNEWAKVMEENREAFNETSNYSGDVYTVRNAIVSVVPDTGNNTVYYRVTASFKKDEEQKTGILMKFDGERIEYTRGSDNYAEGQKAELLNNEYYTVIGAMKCNDNEKTTDLMFEAKVIDKDGFDEKFSCGFQIIDTNGNYSSVIRTDFTNPEFTTPAPSSTTAPTTPTSTSTTIPTSTPTYRLPDFKEETAAYKTIVTVSVNLRNLPNGAEVYIGGIRAEEDEDNYSANIGQIASSKDVRIEVRLGGQTLDSSTLKIKVETGFFSKLVSFFSNFFFNSFKWKEVTIKF